MSIRQRYYLAGLIPIFFILLLLLIEIDALNFWLCFLGFFWPYTLCTPSDWEKWQKRSRKFSILGISHLIKTKLENRFVFLGKARELVARNLPVFVFGITIQSIVVDGPNILFTLIGICIFELFYFLYKKLGKISL